MYLQFSSWWGALTLMFELSMFSKSSAEMVGTLLTRSIRKRPTLLSAVTLPDWDRWNSIIFTATVSVKPHYLTNDRQRHSRPNSGNMTGKTYTGENALSSCTYGNNELITSDFSFNYSPEHHQCMQARWSACPVPWLQSQPPGTDQRLAPWCDWELNVSSVEGPLQRTDESESTVLQRRAK